METKDSFPGLSLHVVVAIPSFGDKYVVPYLLLEMESPMTDKKLPPEPGTVADTELGIPGEAEPRPDYEFDEPTRINDEEDTE